MSVSVYGQLLLYNLNRYKEGQQDFLLPHVSAVPRGMVIFPAMRVNREGFRKFAKESRIDLD